MAEQHKKVIEDKKKQAEQLMTKDQIAKCNVAIHTASIACAAAGAIPIPVADAVPITAAQITMVMALGKIFDVKITESAAKGVIGAAASTFVGRNLVKLIPVVGWGISAGVAAGVTEAIGWTIAVDFSRNEKSREEAKEVSQKHASYEIEDFGIQSEGVSAEEEKSQDPIEILMDQANDFVSGKKKRSENEDEFSTLLSDIENIIDDLPSEHLLRELYDKLTQIID